MIMKAVWWLAILAVAGSAGSAQTAVNAALGETAVIERNKPGREAFTVAAQPGQTLLVELNSGPNELHSDSDQVRVFSPTGTAPLKSDLVEPGTPQRWMGRLSRPGNYRIETTRVAAAGNNKPWMLRVTLMDAHDPRVDPGISIDVLKAAHPGAKFERKGFNPQTVELDEHLPAHIVWSEGDMTVQMMQVAGYEKTIWMEGEGVKRVAALRAAVQKPTGSKPGLFPGAINDDAALTFVVQIRTVRGPGVEGVRWTGSYAQDEGNPVNPLAYCFEGFSTDGRFLVTVHSRVSHPAVPKDVTQMSDAKLNAFRARLAGQLERAPNSSFRPALDQLDSWITGNLFSAK